MLNRIAIFMFVVCALIGCNNVNESVLNGRVSQNPVDKTTANNTTVNEAGKVEEIAAEEKAPERELAYRGEMSLVTDNIPHTSQAIREETKKIGGYLYTLTSNSLDLRIPSTKLEIFMAGLGKYGRVKSSSLSAEDITDNNIDLRVRIENLEKLRARLLSLAEKSQAVEETLKIEKELARVTGELDALKGMLNRSNEKVKYSRLLVSLSTTEPEIKTPVKTPFTWVNNLAKELKNPTVPKPFKGSWWNRNIEVELPDGFATVYDNKNDYWAMNGNDGYFHTYLVKNEVEKPDPKFWQQVVQRHLEEAKLLTIVSVKQVVTKSGNGFQVNATYSSGNSALTYVLQVIPGEDEIVISEFWGNKNSEVLNNPELLMQVLKSVKTSL